MQRTGSPPSPLLPPGHLARSLALLLTALLAACSSSSGKLTIVSVPGLDASTRGTYVYLVKTVSGTGPVTFALATAPAGMTIDATGRIQWSPGNGDLGTHPVTVEAEDDERVASQTFTLRVSQGLLLGTGLSPVGFDSMSSNQDYIDHYQGHAPWGKVIAFHSAWRDSVPLAGRIPTVAEAGLVAAASYGFTPVIGIGWADGSGSPDLVSDGSPENSWFNTETRNEFLGMLDLLVSTYRPPYLFLGNETNSYWAGASDAEWDEWIEVLEEAYQRIKARSPDTVVATVFQYERMKGLGSMTTGWMDPPHLELIDDLEASGMIDAIGFTSYPYFEYSLPDDVPADYYDEISARWSGDVFFTETGWLSSPEPPYPGNANDQADFVEVFFDRTRNIDVRYAAWLFLHDYEDPASIVGFGSIGLRSNDGMTVRAADAAWQDAVALRQE